MHEYLESLSKAYYEGKPRISDVEFDSLAALWDYKKVGYSPTNTKEHLFPLQSLQKCFGIDASPYEYSTLVTSPKLDGAAVSLIYSEGHLILALTRGDGKRGQPITEKMRFLVPNVITTKELVQITGEVVAPSSINNARNYASGALNLKDLQEFRCRELAFIAYGIAPSECILWTQDMMKLRTEGFATVIDQDWSVFPTDGIVFREDNYGVFRSLGSTSQYPKGAFALKERQEGVRTTLLDVLWQVGKSGVVSPVAILEPVKIGDATISRATLHNIEYIKALDLELGCKVEVVRSGEIIPRIVKRVE